jgi:hypothetical protein
MIDFCDVCKMFLLHHDKETCEDQTIYSRLKECSD